MWLQIDPGGSDGYSVLVNSYLILVRTSSHRIVRTSNHFNKLLSILSFNILLTGVYIYIYICTAGGNSVCVFSTYQLRSYVFQKVHVGLSISLRFID